MGVRAMTFRVALGVGVAALIVLLSLLPTRVETPVAETAPPVTLNLVYAYQNSQWNACVEEVIRRFEAAHPEIDVVYEIRYEDVVYEDTLNKLAARNELGDVVQLKEPYGYAESGIIAPLPADLARQVSTRCELDGETYAVGALGSTTGIVYNRALFDRYGLEEPNSYGAFLALCQELRDRGVTPLGVGGKDLWHLEYWVNHFLRADVLSREPDFLALCETGERDWGDPLVTDMLTHLSALFRLGYVDDRWQSTPDGALAYHMVEEEIAMAYSGPFLASDIQALDGGMELGWFYVPNEAGQVVAGESLDVFWAVTAGCARDATRYEAAVTFLNFFYSDGVYEQFCAAMSGRSTLSDVGRGLYPPTGVVDQVEVALTAADQRQSAYIGDEHTPTGFEKRLLNLLAELCGGRYTVAQAQALAQTYWEQCARQEAAYD